MSSIDAFTSCAGNDHTVVTCHKAGSLTRSRQTVRRRCGAFWLNDGTAAHPPNCGRLPGNFLPHCKARGSGRAERGEKGIGTSDPIARRQFGSKPEWGRPSRRWLAGECRRDRRPQPAWRWRASCHARNQLPSIMIEKH